MNSKSKVRKRIERVSECCERDKKRGKYLKGGKYRKKRDKE